MKTITTTHSDFVHMGPTIINLHNLQFDDCGVSVYSKIINNIIITVEDHRRILGGGLGMA
jgi:hypothetical protein